MWNLWVNMSVFLCNEILVPDQINVCHCVGGWEDLGVAESGNRGQDASTSLTFIDNLIPCNKPVLEIICTIACGLRYWMSIYIHSMWTYWLFQESSKAMETSKLFDSELTDKWIHDETVFILFHHVDLATQQVKPTIGWSTRNARNAHPERGVRMREVWDPFWSLEKMELWSKGLNCTLLESSTALFIYAMFTMAIC